MNTEEHHHSTSESNLLEYAKFVGVILLILIMSWVLYSSSNTTGNYEFMRIFMGVFLVVFAGFKLAGYKMFVMMFQGYDLIAKRVKLYAQAYPLIELGLGIMYLTDVYDVARNSILLIVMGVGAVGVFQEIYHRRSGVYCACLGNVIKLPLSTVSLVENVTMAVMAALMLLR